ncbi:MAG: M20/M25/M40 family metallo-hydrolase [Acidimicrobiales bacterium]|nr:M20/M25/M40 family metallo-hydrolase [Acidimicrobiales bacterium]
MGADLLSSVRQRWDDDIVPALLDYIAIPALSPAFDADWAGHGELDRAVELLVAWARARPIAGLQVEVVRLDGLTPVIVAEVPAFGGAGHDGSDGGAPAEGTVLFYGHYDKQPPMTGWLDGLGPWTPVIRDGRLYGRGGADDGYALFATLAAIEAVQAAGGRHARCLVLIEGSEESGSPHLPAYVEALRDRVGTPSLVICLDSGCADYERLWVTTSLRGMAAGVLSVDITSEGRHSGAVGGAIPSTFRIARRLLERIEDSGSGAVLLPEANVEIPAERVSQAAALVDAIGDGIDGYPLLDGVDVRVKPGAEIQLDRTWRPALHVIGADGLPPTDLAGNVLRPRTALKLSLRLPPTADPLAATAALERTLTADPPYGAHVTFTPDTPAPGWNAPPLLPWVANALDEASQAHFGRPVGYVGEGGTIPLMGTLQAGFPDAALLVIGVLGPGSNAHGPNEFLHLEMGVRLTACVADLLGAHAENVAHGANGANGAGAR